MKTTFLRKWIARCVVFGTAALLGAHSLRAAGELEIPLVKTASQEFHGVKLFKRTPSHLSFRHSMGTAVIKISDVNPESIAAVERAMSGLPLEMDPAGSADAPATKTSASAGAAGDSKWAAMMGAVKLKLSEGLKLIGGMGSLWIFLGLMAAIWLLHSLLCAMICKKAGHPGGLLVWLPVFQMIPMFRAAGMSGWWFLAMFIPLLNLIGAILWCVKIAEARNKGFLTAIFLMLPVANLFAFLYLALSNGHRESEESVPVRAPRAFAVG